MPSRFVTTVFAAVILIIGVSFGTSKVYAAPSIHRLEFVVDPRATSGLTVEDRNYRIQQLVADLNTVFRRETIRSFSFNPQTDITIHDPQYHEKCQRQIDLVAPNDILICLSYNAPTRATAASYSKPIRGYVSISGWNAIHDPLSFRFPIEPSDSSNQSAYISQLQTLTHELEHVFGAGGGEYYSLWTVPDPTSIQPISSINMGTPLDIFWKRRNSWYLDPLLHNAFAAGRVISRRQWLNETKFAAPSKLMINTDWEIWPSLTTSSFMESLKFSKIRVLNAIDKSPISGASIQVIRAPDDSSNPATVLANGLSDLNGELEFDWQCISRCFTNWEQSLSIKVQSSGYPNQAEWFTVHDAFQQLAEGAQFPVAVIELQKTDSTYPQVTAQVSGPTQLGDVVTVNIQSSDNKGIFATEVRGHDGAIHCVSSSKNSTCQFKAKWIGSAIPLSISAIDKLGNVSTAVVYYEVVQRSDLLPPTLTISATSNAAIGQTTILRATATDAAGIAHVNFYVDGQLLCRDVSLPFNCKWTPQRTGSFGIEIEAVDKSGGFASAGKIVAVGP